MRPNENDQLTRRVATIIGWTDLEWKQHKPDSKEDFDKMFGEWWGHPPRWMRERDWFQQEDCPTFEQFDKVHGEYEVAPVPHYACWYDGLRDLFSWIELVHRENGHDNAFSLRVSRQHRFLIPPHQWVVDLPWREHKFCDEHLPTAVCKAVEFLGGDMLKLPGG